MFHKMMIVGLALATASVSAQAQDPTQVKTEAPVVVTARGYAQTANAALADVTVIDRAQIEASGAADVKDLLVMQSGIDMPSAGGPGTQTNVFLRGTSSNHVLVLIDGVRAASLNTGAFAWEQLPLDAVERIEIVRGPRAAVWGSDAIGGVIQIFTRRVEGAAVSARYGSYADAAGSAGIGHWNDAGEGFSVNAGTRHVRGFSAQNPAGYSYNPDDDGMRNRNFTARGAVKLGDQRLSAHLLYNNEQTEFDQGVSHNIEQTLGADLRGPVTQNWHQHLSLGAAREDLSTPAFANRFRSHRRSLDWRNRFDLGHGQQLVAGLSLLREKGQSINTATATTAYAGTRDTHAVYAGWYGSAGRADWQLAARHDANNRFGDATTGSAALGLRLAQNWRLVGSWGQGFRAPNLNEQFSPGYGGYYAGNPNLKPERSHTAEGSLEWTPTATLRLKLAHWRTDISQLIAFSSGSFMRAQNVDRARVTGSTLSAHWHNRAWTLDAQATWLNPRNLSTDALLLRRPRRKATLAITRRFGQRLDLGVEALGVGARDDVGGRLAGYALLNAHIDWHINAANTLRLRVDNLANRDYTELLGYNTPGRSLWLTWSWRH